MGDWRKTVPIGLAGLVRFLGWYVSGWSVSDRFIPLSGAKTMVSHVVPAGVLDEFLGTLVAVQNFT